MARPDIILSSISRLQRVNINGYEWVATKTENLTSKSKVIWKILKIYASSCLLLFFIVIFCLYDDAVLQFRLNEPAMPISSCSQTCKKGEMKKFINGDKCCWKCLPCSKYQVNGLMFLI